MTYTTINTQTTAKEIVEAAGLDWEVGTTALYTKNADGELAVVPNARAIVRRDTDHVLDVTGTRFRPIQNEDAIAGFLAATQAGGLAISGVGSMKDGSFIYADAVAHELSGREKLIGKLFMIQPHQHGAAFSVRFTVYRENQTSHTFNVESRAMWRMSHASKFNEAKKEDMATLLGLTKTMLVEYAAKLDALAVKTATESEQLQYIARVIQPDLLATDEVPTNINDALVSDATKRRFRTVAAILAEEQDGTMLSAYTSVCRALDFTFGRSDENRFYNNLLGTSVNIKARALDLA